MAILCEYCGNPTTFLSLKAAGRLLHRDPKTMRKYLDQGRFPGSVLVWKGTGRQAWRIPVTAILPLLQDQEDS